MARELGTIPTGSVRTLGDVSPTASTLNPYFNSAVQPQQSLSSKIWGGLAKTGDVLGDVFGGKQIGQAIGTLGGYGLTVAQEAVGLAPKGSTANYDLSAPTPLQVAGDVARSAATVLPTTGIETVGANLASKVPIVSKAAGLIGATGAGIATGYGLDVGTNLAEGKSISDSVQPGVMTAVGGLAPLGAKIIGTVIAKPVKAIYSQFKPEAVDAMTRALKPDATKINFSKTIEDVLPALSTYVKDTGKTIKSVDDVVDATKQIKKSLWANYESSLGKSTDHWIDGNQIADAMVNSVDKRTAIQNPALVKKINEVADTYRGFINPADAEDFLQSANAELYSYYAKNKVAQHVAEKDPTVKYVINEANALRDALYRTIENATGKDVAPLKKLYGNLSSFQEVAQKRAAVVGGQSPFSLAEQISIPMAVTNAARSALNLKVGDAVMSLGQVGITKLLKGANLPDNLVKTSLEQFNKATTAQQKQSFVSSLVKKLGGEEKVRKFLLGEKLFNFSKK